MAKSWTSQRFDPGLSWQDVEWIKRRWGGKLIIKGIMDAEDARLCVAAGADALIVSNHGGRQLDGAQSSIAALPAIVEAVGKRIEVRMDGGIRSSGARYPAAGQLSGRRPLAADGGVLAGESVFGRRAAELHAFGGVVAGGAA